jgi:hypothetical protein
MNNAIFSGYLNIKARQHSKTTLKLAINLQLKKWFFYFYYKKYNILYKYLIIKCNYRNL